MPFYHGGHLTKDLYGAVSSVLNVGGIKWLLLDRYSTDRAAGAINGTLSEPSGHARTLTDSAPNAVITGGQFKVTAGAAARDPWLRYTTGWARVAGRMLRFDASAQDSGIAADPTVGLANTLTTPGLSAVLGIGFYPTLIYAGVASTRIASYSAGTLLTTMVILRSTGHYVLIDGKLVFIYRAGSTATLYPSFATNGADAAEDFRLDNLGIADLPLTNPALYPTPELSDTFPVPSIVDYGDNGLNGTPVNVTLKSTSGKYQNGAYINVIGAGFNSFFSGAEGTAIFRAKAYDSGTTQYLANIYAVSATDRLYFYLISGKDFTIGHRGGGTTAADTASAASADNAYHTWGGTWSESADEVTAYVDGSASGSPASSLGTYSGSLTVAVIGASEPSPANNFRSDMQDVIIANTVASPAQMATIHAALAAGTLTKATLDGIFGAGNYVWYKHTEQYLSNGLAHVETNTVTALDAGGNALNGTHVNVKLNGSYGEYRAALLPYTNIYSANLNTKFNGKEGFVLARARVANPQVWSDGIAHEVLRMYVDASNYLSVQKDTSNRLAWGYSAGGTPKGATKTVAPLTWFTLGQTFSDTADTLRVFYSGAQEGADITGIGVWAGNLSASATVIGATSTSAVLPWSGDISDVIIGLNGTVATPTQMADLHTYLNAGTLTADILNTMFGALNWAWYKLDESVTYPTAYAWDGAGLSWNAGGKAYISPTPGAELLTNPSFTAWTADNPDGWTVTGESLPDADCNEVGSGESHGGAGTGSCNLYHAAAAGNFVPAIAQGVLTLGEFYRGTATISYITGSSLDFNMGGRNPIFAASGSGTGKATSNTSVTINPRVGTGTLAEVTLDAVSCTHLDFADCLRHISPASAAEPYLSAKLTITDKTQAGFVINLDNGTTPGACIHVYCDRIDGKIYARPMAAGAWGADTLAGVAFTYSAGAYLEVRRIGTEMYVFYNGAYVGTWTTAVPSTNTKIALFATNSASYFENVTVYPTGGYDYTEYA